MELRIQRWSESEPPDEAELKRRLSGEGFDAFVWHDGPAADYAPHTHEHDESLWVVRGLITFGVEGRSHALGPGDRLMLPAGTLHSAVAGRDGATYLIGRRSLKSSAAREEAS